jgi:hypothetical protein
VQNFLSHPKRRMQIEGVLVEILNQKKYEAGEN